MNKKNHLVFQAVQLWQRRVVNRFVVAPMTRVSATATGEANAEMVRYYASFAAGGFGTIITEGIYTDALYSKGYCNQPGLVTPEHVQAWSTVTASVQQYPTLIFAQLMHAGALSQSLGQTAAPSAIQPKGGKAEAYGGNGVFPMPKEMSLRDIGAVKEGFIQATNHAFQAGFDGVEIHAANGYLLDQFLTPELNLRTDRYGGSLQNRFRIVAEILQGIRKVVPDDFIVGLRISEGKVNDLGYRWKEGALAAADLMQEIKTSTPDYIHIAVQTGEWERDSFYTAGKSLASIAKEVTGLPVIVNGGMHDLDRAFTAIDEHRVDLVAIGKAALADPDWPNKTLNDRPVVKFDRDMLWPEATIAHSQNIIRQISNVSHK